MRTTPFWTDDYPKPIDLAVSKLPHDADVAVVGSGYTGLNAALAMAEAGLKVVVLEKETIGWGASSRNGTMLGTGLKASGKQMKKMYGVEKAHKFWQWSLDAIDYVEDVVKKEKIECDFVRPGHVYLASKPKHVQKVRARGEFLKLNFGYEDFNYVEKEDLQDEIGSQAFYYGMTEDHPAALHPAKFVFGLAEAAAEKGVQLVEHAEVKRISHQNGCFTLKTTQGDLAAKGVLLATGGYTTQIIPKVRQGIFPVGSYIIVTEPLPEDLQEELSPKRRMFYNSKRFLNYFCLTPDGRMMFGGRANLSPSLDEFKSAKYLMDQMLRVFPQLKGFPITHSWTGRLGISFDQMPHVGLADGVYYANGYCGHGISIASYLGYEVGNLIAGKIGQSMFMEIPHPRYLFAPLDKLYLPFVSTYFKLEDILT